MLLMKNQSGTTNFVLISTYLDQDITAAILIHLHEIQIADEFADLKDQKPT